VKKTREDTLNGRREGGREEGRQETRQEERHVPVHQGDRTGANKGRAAQAKESVDKLSVPALVVDKVDTARAKEDFPAEEELGTDHVHTNGGAADEVRVAGLEGREGGREERREGVKSLSKPPSNCTRSDR
jgi:hypothetical protein